MWIILLFVVTVVYRIRLGANDGRLLWLNSLKCEAGVGCLEGFDLCKESIKTWKLYNPGRVTDSVRNFVLPFFGDGLGIADDFIHNGVLWVPGVIFVHLLRYGKASFTNIRLMTKNAF